MAGIGYSAIPHDIPIQGIFQDSDGNYYSGNYNVSLRIYDTYTGGNLLYEQVGNLTITNGKMSSIMKNINASFDAPYYVGVAVYNDDEMTSRINLTMSPYAYRCEISDNATDGSIDNSSIDSNTDYSFGNLTIGKKLIFGLGEIIDNLIDGTIRITGDFNVSKTIYAGYVIGNLSNSTSYKATNIDWAGTTGFSDLTDDTGTFTAGSSINVSELNVTGAIVFSLYPNWDTNSGDDLSLVTLDNGTVIRDHNTSWVIDIPSLWNFANNASVYELLVRASIVSNMSSLDNSSHIGVQNITWITSNQLITGNTTQEIIDSVTGINANFTTLNVSGRSLYGGQGKIFWNATMGALVIKG